MDHELAGQTVHPGTERADWEVIGRMTDEMTRSAREHPEHFGAAGNALAAVVEHHFSGMSWNGWLRVSSPAEQASAWKVTQQWQMIDPERFDEAAHNLTERLRRYYGRDLTDRLEALGKGRLDDAARVVEEAARGRFVVVGERRRPRRIPQDDPANASGPYQG